MLHMQVTCIIIRVPSQVLGLVDCLNLIYIFVKGVLSLCMEWVVVNRSINKQ